MIEDNSNSSISKLFPSSLLKEEKKIVRTDVRCQGRGCQYQLENTAFGEIFGSAVDEWFNNPISELGCAHENEFKQHVWRKAYWDSNSIKPCSNQLIHVSLVEPGRPGRV